MLLNGGVITEDNEWDSQELTIVDILLLSYGAETEVWRASQEGVSVVIVVNPGSYFRKWFLEHGFWKIIYLESTTDLSTIQKELQVL